MKLKLFLVLILAALASLGSCARKATPSGKIRINLGASASSPVVNGVYIWGRNKTFGLTFGAHISGNGREIELPLKPGVWNFKVIAWDGANMFEGVPRCGSHGDIAFQNGDVDVPIHISSNCDHPFFVPNSNYLATVGDITKIRPLRLVNCRSLALVTKGDDLCENAYAGEAQSFRVILPSYLPRSEQEIGPFSTASLKSACIPIGSYTDTMLRIPLGNGSPESAQVYFESFSSTDCTGVPKHTPFRFGLAATQGVHGKLYPPINAVTRNTFFLKHGENLGDGDLNVFGNGKDGDFNLFGTVDFTTISTDPDGGGAQLPDRRISPRRRIKSVTAHPSGTAIIETATSFNYTGPVFDFLLGDEVMWHVTINTSTEAACDDLPQGDPNHLAPGKYGYAKIQSITDDTHLVLDRPLPVMPVNNIWNSSGDLLAANNPPNAKCVMQIIRVPNFNSLSVTAVTTILVPPFELGPGASLTTGHGGIIPIRVKNTINFTGGYTLTIGSGGLGFDSFDNSGAPILKFQGAGPTGFTQYACPGNNCSGNIGMAAGAGITGPAGGGGGGHIGQGGSGGYDGIGVPGMGGSAIAPIPLPQENIILMGASGGHGKFTTSFTSAQSGGRGGGIILLAARVITGSSGSLSLNGNGKNGNLSASDNNGGGGGAGGSVYLFTQYSNINTISAYANGGNGQLGGAAGACGGGGGGGGLVFIRACAHSVTNFNQVGPIVGPGDAGANDASCISSSAQGGTAGFEDKNFSYHHYFCP